MISAANNIKGTVNQLKRLAFSDEAGDYGYNGKYSGSACHGYEDSDEVLICATEKINFKNKRESDNENREKFAIMDIKEACEKGNLCYGKDDDGVPITPNETCIIHDACPVPGSTLKDVYYDYTDFYSDLKSMFKSLLDPPVDTSPTKNLKSKRAQLKEKTIAEMKDIIEQYNELPYPSSSGSNSVSGSLSGTQNNNTDSLPCDKRQIAEIKKILPKIITKQNKTKQNNPVNSGNQNNQNKSVNSGNSGNVKTGGGIKTKKAKLKRGGGNNNNNNNNTKDTSATANAPPGNGGNATPAKSNANADPSANANAAPANVKATNGNANNGQSATNAPANAAPADPPANAAPAANGQSANNGQNQEDTLLSEDQKIQKMNQWYDNWMSNENLGKRASIGCDNNLFFSGDNVDKKEDIFRKKQKTPQEVKDFWIEKFTKEFQEKQIKNQELEDINAEEEGGEKKVKPKKGKFKTVVGVGIAGGKWIGKKSLSGLDVVTLGGSGSAGRFVKNKIYGDIPGVDLSCDMLDISMLDTPKQMSGIIKTVAVGLKNIVAAGIDETEANHGLTDSEFDKKMTKSANKKTMGSCICKHYIPTGIFEFDWKYYRLCFLNFKQLLKIAKAKGTKPEFIESRLRELFLEDFFENFGGDFIAYRELLIKFDELYRILCQIKLRIIPGGNALSVPKLNYMILKLEELDNPEKIMKKRLKEREVDGQFLKDRGVGNKS